MDSDTDTVLELRMKAHFLKNVSEVLRELFITASFMFSSRGFVLRAMDRDTSAFVASEPYICDNDPGHSVRLNLADMAKAFSFANNDDIVTIKYENDRKIVTISFDSPECAVISDLDFDFLGEPVYISEYLYEKPEHMYDAIVRMPSAQFVHFCNKLSSFWDTGDRKTAAVCISVDKDRVSFSTDGEFKSSTIVCLQAHYKRNEATCIEMRKKTSLTFDLRYLKNFSKASTMSDQVTIKLSHNRTAVFECKAVKMGYIRYHMMSDSSDPPAPLPLCRSPPVKAPATLLELQMEATFLKNLLEVLSLSGLFSKANFEFSSTGLELQATDTCCMALVELQLRSKAFNSYICNNVLSVGLILADMAKASSFTNNDDIVTIEAQDQDGVKVVVIKFKSPGGSVIQNFKLNFVSVDDVPFTIPECQEFQYEAIIRMPSAEFMHICNQLNRFTDMETAFVCISVNKDCVRFFADDSHGYFTIKSRLIQTVDKSKEATYIEVKREKNVSLTFGLRYMSSLCKAYTLSQQVTIKLSSKLPAVFEYNIAEKGYIRYHMMPTELTD
ncbi:unnamed protein product [Urochloa humidicola]